MPKRLAEKQKEEITKLFTSGETIDNLSIQYNCTNSTIIRNLKKYLGEKKYKELISKGRSNKKNLESKDQNILIKNRKKIDKNNKQEAKFTVDISNNNYEEIFTETPFVEITPLNYEIDNIPQKDLSSVSISKVDFPNIVYMIVHKNIELETKYLKEFPQWQFLSKDELNRKTIEVHFDLKIAKRFCNKEQKVIKVPNTDVFKIVAPILLEKGISRIVSPDQLIAL